MNISAFTERIEKYLAGTMSAGEVRAFESDLEKNPAIKKAFITYSIQAYKPPPENKYQTRQFIESVYATLPPVSTPVLPLLLRLKLWFQPLSSKLIVGGLFLALALAVFWPKSSLNIESLIAQNAEPATCKSVAGAVLTARQLFEKASDAYCGHETDPGALAALQQLSANSDTFCMADYFIAHWFLKNGRYAEALLAFEACLAARQTIEANQETAESRNALLFNTLLARLGKEKNIAAVLPELESLTKTAKPGSRIAEKVKSLTALLTPLAK